ncbi:MAG: hypothetical protein EAZ84_11595 [Verrucomicrobia bacterium]|nr:MAG: hypothetical protein EAZ84_11595 [Verrucomicrobiota bacterium]TAE88717.1 MAG: hypothetical protein EAZ82_03180 [Verrucomicrobiota bacterium]TAF26519.1 MAG: hypothetical protein EAZ71_04705 [Verrucomicrobiota bacterium]
MNSPLSIFFLLVATALTAAAVDAPARVEMREVATHEQIVEAARIAREAAPPSVFKPAEGEDPSKVNKPGDLISRSDILCFQGRATLVPKRAVLHIPKGLADRVGMKPGSQIGSWTEFLTANRAWIRTVPVTRIQAEGNAPMPEGVVKSFDKEQRVVIATYQEGPISVLPLKQVDPTAPVGAEGPSNTSPPNIAKP